MEEINKMKIYTKVLCIFLGVVMLTSCRNNQLSPNIQQAWSNTSKEIVIGVAGPIDTMRETTNFLDGIYMAVNEVNKSGVLDNLSLHIVEMDDQGSFLEGTTAAQLIVQRPNVIAVIGHWNTHVTVPASTIYDDAKIILVSPIISNAQLTQRGYTRVFRNIPGDSAMGKDIVSFFKRNGYKKIAVYYADNPYGKGLADAFEDGAREQGIDVIDRTSGFEDDIAFYRTIEKWKAMDCDAVFVGDEMPQGGEFIKKLNKTDLDVLILGDAGLDVDYIKDMGLDAEGTIVTTIYNPHQNNPKLHDFIQTYIEIYGKEPDMWAVQGYESIKLLADGIIAAGTANPDEIAKALHEMDEWEGVTDKISFDKNGEVIGKKLYFMKVKNGKFEYVE